MQKEMPQQTAGNEKKEGDTTTIAAGPEAEDQLERSADGGPR